MMKSVVVACGVFCLFTAVGLADDGWVSLFDGKTLDGWEQKNGLATYEVEDGAILGTTAKSSPNSFLCSKKLYGDFELEFEVKVDHGLNSGCQIRSKTKTTGGKGKNNQVGRVYGPQVEIECGPAEAGYVYGEAVGGGWRTPMERLIPHDHFKNDDWNKFRIVARGPVIETFINGEKIETLDDPEIYETHPKGFIGLQVHGIGDSDKKLQVRWRKLRIKELGE